MQAERRPVATVSRVSERLSPTNKTAQVLVSIQALRNTLFSMQFTCLLDTLSGNIQSPTYSSDSTTK